MKTCKQRVNSSWKNTRKDIKSYLAGDLELDSLLLSVEYIEPGTFNNKRGYHRLLFSWGGPSDELRVFSPDKVEYWFLDWHDGASIDVTNDPVVQKFINNVLEL